MNYTYIDNFIFDFGGVLYEIDTEISIKKLCNLSSDPFIREKGMFQDYSNYNLFNDYECGKISTDFFLDKLKEEFRLNISNEELISIWNETLIGLYQNSIQLIKRFKKCGRIYLFSNTSEIHYTKFFPECTQLFEQFDECFFSFKIGLRKPDPASYNYIIAKHSLVPSRTLFIDDLFKNIEGARYVGLNVYHINSVNSLSDLLHSVEYDTQA